LISKPTPVRMQLVERLRASITDGTFKPGDRLIERELCETLQVSRPSIREALRQLEAEALVDIIPNRGPMVRLIETDELIELWDLRLAIGGLAARRFAEHGLPADIDEFEERIKVHAHALASQDQHAIKSTKSALFESFAAGAHNRPLSAAFSQINARVSFFWSSSLKIPGRPQESVAELFTLLGAIRQRNPDAAHAAFLLYSEHAKTVALHGLEKRDPARKPARSSRVEQETMI
jgi:DNA-binding GntR family transcriptional regulator